MRHLVKIISDTVITYHSLLRKKRDPLIDCCIIVSILTINSFVDEDKKRVFCESHMSRRNVNVYISCSHHINTHDDLSFVR